MPGNGALDPDTGSSYSARQPIFRNSMPPSFVYRAPVATTVPVPQNPQQTHSVHGNLQRSRRPGVAVNIQGQTSHMSLIHLPASSKSM